MTDPLFGISYDPAEMKFEEAATVREKCPQIQDQFAWIYAHLSTRNTEYFILSGLTHVCPDGPGVCHTSPDIAGTIVASRGSKCSVESVDSFYWRTGDTLWNLPQRDLDEFARDALRRYAKAFGSKRAFLRNVTHREYLAPTLRQQLEIFEKQSAP